MRCALIGSQLLSGRVASTMAADPQRLTIGMLSTHEKGPLRRFRLRGVVLWYSLENFYLVACMFLRPLHTRAHLRRPLSSLGMLLRLPTSPLSVCSSSPLLWFVRKCCVDGNLGFECEVWLKTCCQKTTRCESCGNLSVLPWPLPVDRNRRVGTQFTGRLRAAHDRKLRT